MITTHLKSAAIPSLANAFFSPDGSAGSAQSINKRITTELLQIHLENEDATAFNRDRSSLKGKINLSGLRTLAGKNLSGVNFDGVILNNVDFSNCALEGAIFTNSSCIGATFDGASAAGADFTDAKMQRASFQKGKRRTDLSGAIFCNTNLSQSRLDLAIFDSTNLYKANFTSAVGVDVSFVGSNLIEADMRLTWFSPKTSFKGAYARDLKQSGFNCRDRNLLEDAILNEDPPTGKFPTSAPKVIESKLIDGIPGTNREIYDRALSELNALIGLVPVKNEIKELVASLQIEQLEIKAGLPEIKLNQHYAFVGPSGTGKTTVARYFGQLLRSLGYLEIGHLVEADRSDLVAGFKGQTAIKTRELVESAFGGVLLIDEAYSLYQGEEDTFGKEAIDTLLKLMEDNADKLVVIFCGYNKEMQKFIETNPGLKSRVSDFVPFKDYGLGELVDILRLKLDQAGRIYNPEFLAYASALCLLEQHKSGENFGNGRFIRNLFNQTIRNQRSRIQLARKESSLVPSRVDLATLELSDLAFESYAGFKPESLDLIALRWLDATSGPAKSYRLKDLNNLKGPYPNLDVASFNDILKLIA